MATDLLTEKKSSSAADQVPTSKRFLWGMGGFSDAMMYYGVNGLIDQVYVIALGYHAFMISLIRALPRFLDFVTDPLVGHLSDNTRTRWGRRRPWMLAGLLISAVVAAFMWYPPQVPQVEANASSIAVFWAQLKTALFVQWHGALFITLTMIALYTVGYSFFTITYTGMGYEMTDNYNERTHLFKWRMMAYAAGCLFAPWLRYLCLWFEGDKSTVTKGAQGAHSVGILLGAVIILAGLLPIIFCKEKIVSPRSDKEHVSFFAAARYTMSNTAFWPLLLGNLISKFGMIITQIFFYYVFYYHMGRGNNKAGAAYFGMYCNAINLVNLFIGMAAVAWVCDRLGKKPTLLFLMAMSVVTYATMWYTTSTADSAYTTLRIHIGILNWSAPVQWPCLITGAMIGLFTNTMPMIMNSMLADVCDLDELKTGQRRDAFYSGVFVSCDKMAMAIGTVFQGALLIWSGFDPKLSMQNPQTINLWILMIVLTQPLGFLLGFFAIVFYPLSRKKCEEVRAQLDAREQQAS